MIKLNTGLCVRSLSVESQCNRCEVICPTNAISFIDTNPLPAINFHQCVVCGACAGVCPDEALELEEFSATNFFFDFIEDEDNLLSCRKNVPCIASLGVEHIISMAILKGELIFDMGYCSGCEIASTCKPQIEENYEEAIYLLEAMESNSVIKLEDIKYKNDSEKPSDRRDFLSALNLKTIAKVKKSFKDEMQKASDALIEHTLQKRDIALLKKKSIPNKRKILFAAIKRAEKPSVFHTVDADEVSFTSQKMIDKEACTACQMCYRVCPTGALTSDLKNSKIDFDPFLCIKCHTCHDVCEPDAITLSNIYNIKEFFEPEVVNLVAFSVKRCSECGMVFSSNNSDDTLCRRCQIEEDEARDLWGIRTLL